MSLEDWGVIAEIVGAIAVVMTLVYLAVQVKHSAVQVRHSMDSLDAHTKAIRGQAISDVTRNVHDQMQMLMQGHDVTAWFIKFIQGETLDAQDAILTDAFLSAIFMARQNEFLQWQQGLLDEDVFKSLHHVTVVLLESPNGQHWWQHEGCKMYAPAFVRFVDELCAGGASEDFQSFKHAVRLSDVDTSQN